MVEKLFAALGLIACLGALLRMGLRPRARARFDAALQAAWQRCRALAQRITHRRPAPRPHDAARLAEEAIRRAREGHWEGNVFRSRSFRRRKKPH